MLHATRENSAQSIESCTTKCRRQIFEEEKSSLINTIPPALKFGTRRRAHLFRELPLHWVSAEEALRFLVSLLFERSFPFALRGELVDAFLFDMAVQASPIARGEIGDFCRVDVIIYFELLGDVMVGMRWRWVVEAYAGPRWFCAGEEGGQKWNDEE
jgi:hypothetical protein